jgi:hypothetical protein
MKMGLDCLSNTLQLSSCRLAINRMPIEEQASVFFGILSSLLH